MSRARGPHSPRQAQREVASSTSTSSPACELIQARSWVPERGAGDDPEAILLELRDREVALDPAAAVEHLRVGDLARAADDAVVAQPLEQRRRARPADLELGERGLVEERGGLSRGRMLGADGGRPVLPRPAARAQRLVAARGVRLVPVHPFPAGLLAEGGAVLPVPVVDRGDAQRPPRLALVARVLDVVVGLVDLARALERVGGRAVVLAEAPHVHLPHVERRLALGDPLRHQLAHPARAREPVGAEAGGDEEAAHVRLAEQELAVGRERLRPVDQPRDRDLVHHRHALAGVDGDLLEALPVLLEQAAVEVGGDGVDAGLVERPRRGVALVAAHHEPAGVLAEVDEEVRVAHGRQRLRPGRDRGTAA